MAPANPRLLFLLAFLGCVALLGGALYLEHGVGLNPCPLCIVQRIFVILVGLTCLIAAIHAPQRTGRRAYAALVLLLAVGGGATAARQVWLQGVPVDQLQACLPSLEFMIQALPLQDIVSLVFRGTADCAEVTWTLFGLSLPEWSLLAFLGMALFALFQALRRG